jgi:hypothetical protein
MIKWKESRIMAFLYFFILFLRGILMELISKQVDEYQYRLEFKDTVGNQLIKAVVEFYEAWSLTSKKNILEDFGNTVGFYMPALQVEESPYNVRTNIKTLPVHIPHLLGRYLFKSCFDYFIEQTDAPVQVSTMVEHPGYPLVVVTFDSSVITQPITVQRWIDNIMAGIRNCKFTTEEIENTSPEQEDEFDDEVDENIIVEFELDDDLKEAMKGSASDEFLDVTDEEIDEFVKKAREKVHD